MQYSKGKLSALMSVKNKLQMRQSTGGMLEQTDYD